MEQRLLASHPGPHPLLPGSKGGGGGCLQRPPWALGPPPSELLLCAGTGAGWGLRLPTSPCSRREGSQGCGEGGTHSSDGGPWCPRRRRRSQGSQSQAPQNPGPPGTPSHSPWRSASGPEAGLAQRPGAKRGRGWGREGRPWGGRCEGRLAGLWWGRICRGPWGPHPWAPRSGQRLVWCEGGRAPPLSLRDAALGQEGRERGWAAASAWNPGEGHPRRPLSLAKDLHALRLCPWDVCSPLPPGAGHVGETLPHPGLPAWRSDL